MAGFIGVDPRPFTVRQLCIMTEGREDREWNWWAELLALTANCHRKTPIHSSTIHPYRRNKKRGSGNGVGDAVAAMGAKYGRYGLGSPTALPAPRSRGRGRNGGRPKRN